MVFPGFCSGHRRRLRFWAALESRWSDMDTSKCGQIAAEPGRSSGLLVQPLNAGDVGRRLAALAVLPQGG
jgi:hypothetical protein